MKILCPYCDDKFDLKISDRSLLFTYQVCDHCKHQFTQLLRNVRIQDGKLIGDIVDHDEPMHGIGPEEETNDGK